MTPEARRRIGEEYGDALLGSPTALRHVARHIPTLLDALDEAEEHLLNLCYEFNSSPTSIWGVERARLQTERDEAVGLLKLQDPGKDFSDDKTLPIVTLYAPSTNRIREFLGRMGEARTP